MSASLIKASARPVLETKTSHSAADTGDKKALCLTPKKANRHHRNQSAIGSPKSANAAVLSPGNVSPQPNHSPASLSDRPASPALRSPNASPSPHPRRTGRSRNHTRSRSSIEFNPIRSFCIEVEGPGVDAARRVISPPPPPAARAGAFPARVLSPPSSSSPATTKDRVRDSVRSKSPPAGDTAMRAPSPLRLSKSHQPPSLGLPPPPPPPPPPPSASGEQQRRDSSAPGDVGDGAKAPTDSAQGAPALPPSVSDHLQGSSSVAALRRQLFEQKAAASAQPTIGASATAVGSPGVGAQILRKITKPEAAESIMSPSVSSTIRSLQQMTSPPPNPSAQRVAEPNAALARSESFESSKKLVAKTIEEVMRNSSQKDSPSFKPRTVSQSPSDSACTRLRSPPPVDAGSVHSVVSGSVSDCTTRKRAGSSIPPPPPPSSSHATVSASAATSKLRNESVGSPSVRGASERAVDMGFKSPPPPSVLSPPWVPLPPPAQPTPPPIAEDSTTPRREEVKASAATAEQLAAENLSPVSAACTSSAAAFRTHEALLASLRMSAEEKDPQTARKFRVSDYLQTNTPPIIRPMSPGALATRMSNNQQVRSPVASVTSPPSKVKAVGSHPPALSLLAAVASPRPERRDTVQKAKPSDAQPRVSMSREEEAAQGVGRLIAGPLVAAEPQQAPEEEENGNGPECSVLTTAETSILENAIELPNGHVITDNDIVIKQGTLQKRVHTSIWALQRSQKRHFVLSQTYLSYYKKRPDRLTAKRPTVILLEHIASVRCFSEGPKRAIFGISGGNNFNIATGSCRFDITLLPHKVVDHMVSNGLDASAENARTRAHYTLIADTPAEALQWVTLISNGLYRIQSQPSQWRPSWHNGADDSHELSVTRMLKNAPLGASFGSSAGSSTHEWSEESSLGDGESEHSISHESSDEDEEEDEDEETPAQHSLFPPPTGRRALGSLSTAGGSCLSEASLTVKSECGGERKTGGGSQLTSLQRSYHKHVESAKEDHPTSNITVLYSLLFVLSGSVTRDKSVAAKNPLTTSAPAPSPSDHKDPSSSGGSSSKKCHFKGCNAVKASAHSQYCSAHYRKTSKGGDTLNAQTLAELAILKDIHMHQKLIEWSNTRKALRAVSRLLCGTEDRHEQDLSIRCLFLMLHRKSSAIPHSAGCVQVGSGCDLASKTSANASPSKSGDIPSASPAGHCREDSRAEAALLKMREAASNEEKGAGPKMKKRMSMANIYTAGPPLPPRPLPESIAETPSEQEPPSAVLGASKSSGTVDTDGGSIIECESCSRLSSYFAAYLRKAVTGKCSIAPFSPSREAGRSSRFTHTMWRSILALLITPLPDISHVDPEHLLSFNQTVCNTQVWRAAFECLCRASLEVRIAALEDLNGLLIGSPLNREVLLCQPRWPSLISSLLLDLDHLNGETECKKPQTLTKSKQDEYQSFQFTTNIFTLLLFHACVGISTDDSSDESNSSGTPPVSVMPHRPSTSLAQPTPSTADATGTIISSFLSRSNSGSINGSNASKDSKDKSDAPASAASSSTTSVVSRPFQALASFFTRKRGKSSDKQQQSQASSKASEPASGKSDLKSQPARPISTPLSPTTVPAPASLARQFFPSSSESKLDQVAAKPQVKLSLIVCQSFQDLLVETIRTVQRSFHNAPPSLLYARGILMALVNKVSANKTLLRTDYSHQSWENAVRLGEAVKTFLFCTPTLGQAPAYEPTRDRNRTLSRGSLAMRADPTVGRARRVSSSTTVRFGDLVGFGLHWDMNDELASGDLEMAKATAKLIHSINPVNHMQEGTEAEIEEYLSCSGSYSPTDKEMILRLRHQTDFFQHAITMLELLASQKQKLSHWEVSSFVEELFIATNRKGQSRVIDSVKARIALHCRKA